MRFGDLLVAQRRELAISSEAAHAQLHDATISDIGSMPLACWTGSGSPPVFKSVFPQAIYRAEIPMNNGLDELFQYHANKHWIECKDSTTDTCAIFAERKLVTEATGLLGLSVIGRAYTWATQTNENTKLSSYYRPAISHIADLTFLGYESTCDVLIKDIDQNNHVFKTGDCKPVSGAKPFTISFPSTQGAILKYTFFEDKNTPLTPALALETTYTPSSSDAKIFGKSTVRAPIKPNTTSAATYATAISRPFCGVPSPEKPVP